MTEKTWENLEVGDQLNIVSIVEHPTDYVVLGICGEVVFYGTVGKTDCYTQRKQYLINNCWKIKGASEDKPKEIKEAILLLESIPVDYYGSSDRTDICKVIEMLKKLK